MPFASSFRGRLAKIMKSDLKVKQNCWRKLPSTRDGELCHGATREPGGTQARTGPGPVRATAAALCPGWLGKAAVHCFGTKCCIRSTGIDLKLA